MNGVLEKGGAAREVRTHCQLPRYKSDFKKKKAESYVNGTSLWVAKNGGGGDTHTMLRHSAKLRGLRATSMYNYITPAVLRQTQMVTYEEKLVHVVIYITPQNVVKVGP